MDFPFYIKAGADVNKTDDYCDTPLLHAVQNGHLRCVNALIKAGADVNYVEKYGLPIYIRLPDVVILNV